MVSFIDRAAWRDNVDIGDTQLLKQLLDSNGFDSNRLLEEANTQPIKSMLFRNNARLAGMVGSCVCGRNVHSYLLFGLQSELRLLMSHFVLPSYHHGS